MMVIGRSTAAALLAIPAARRIFLLSSFSLIAAPRPSAAFPPPLSSQKQAGYHRPSARSASLPSDSCASTSPASAAEASSLTSTAMAMSTDAGTGYLNAEDAAALDAELMATPGFSLEQLMELAGLAVAEAVYDVAVDEGGKGGKKHALLVCGPGNNGGDGLVAARHLVHFGLDATIVYPKRSSKPHFINLVKQCEDMGIPILDEIPMDDANEGYDVIVDSIFGFSFHGTAPREPYATAIANMVELQKKQKSLLVSVDVPSGWDVDGGDLTGTNFHPDVLVSLTAPKLSAKKFRGRHFVGGRFLPPAIAEKYGIRMPPYPGKTQMPPYPGLRHSMEVPSGTDEGEKDDPEDWAAQYQAYLAETEQLEHADVEEQQEDTVVEDWAVQYAKYCEEKEREFFESNKIEE